MQTKDFTKVTKDLLHIYCTTATIPAWEHINLAASMKHLENSMCSTV